MKYRPHEHHKGEGSDLEFIYNQAEELITKNQVDPNSFRDLYGDQNVDRDLAIVEDLEEKIKNQQTAEEKESLRLATILEAVIYEQGEKSNWFGPDAMTIKTSRFDDLTNGIDGVVEFNEDQKSTSHLAFGIDATYGHYIAKKITRIREKIDNNQLAEVKYFQSESSHFQGRLHKIPLFVVAIHPQTVHQLAELWSMKEHKTLAEHPVQLQILDEIVEQSGKFGLYAEKIGNTEIAKKYSIIGNLAQEILEEKNKTGIKTHHDLSHLELKQVLSMLVRTDL